MNGKTGSSTVWYSSSNVRVSSSPLSSLFTMLWSDVYQEFEWARPVKCDIHYCHTFVFVCEGIHWCRRSWSHCLCIGVVVWPATPFLSKSTGLQKRGISVVYFCIMRSSTECLATDLTLVCETFEKVRQRTNTDMQGAMCSQCCFVMLLSTDRTGKYSVIRKHNTKVSLSVP